MANQWYVYMILTEKSRLYTGITTNLERRYQEHLDVSEGRGSKGAKYFRADSPLRLVFTECFEDRANASRRESEIKKMTRRAKEALINGVDI